MEKAILLSALIATNILIGGFVMNEKSVATNDNKPYVCMVDTNKSLILITESEKSRQLVEDIYQIVNNE